jgi:hypothetical protein
VKREAFACFGILHRQIGPGLKSLTLSLAKQPSIKEQLQKCFEESSFDPKMVSNVWKRSTLAGQIASGNGTGESKVPALALEIPKLDLMTTLPSDILSKLVRHLREIYLCYLCDFKLKFV